ncbi:profilin [Aspergillus pseudocaelatus]|uniref:Profilin n=1 Tax=Aspergillus pseudocaelatus TaxID=1825620 RepID=A0ABQ6X1S5_9EURO|nr:profilin [Aspergillus pseudocaelatus]
MSWQAYVDHHLIGSGKITRAVILGQRGGVWAHSIGYEEQRTVSDAYNDRDHVLNSGLELAGRKFFTLSANPRSIYLKARADGAIVVKTTQAIIVAEYGAPVQHLEAAKVVEELADYLISVTY